MQLRLTCQFNSTWSWLSILLYLGALLNSTLAKVGVPSSISSKSGAGDEKRARFLFGPGFGGHYGNGAGGQLSLGLGVGVGLGLSKYGGGGHHHHNPFHFQPYHQYQGIGHAYQGAAQFPYLGLGGGFGYQKHFHHGHFGGHYHGIHGHYPHPFGVSPYFGGGLGLGFGGSGGYSFH